MDTHLTIHDVQRVQVEALSLEANHTTNEKALSWFMLRIFGVDGNRHEIVLFGPANELPAFIVSPPLKCIKGEHLTAVVRVKGEAT